MATQLPPPTKKQKVAEAERAREQQHIADSFPPDAGTIRVRFFDESSGDPIGGTFSVAVIDATVKNLELLVNRLLGKESASERIPYRFSLINGSSEGESLTSNIDVVRDLYHSILEPRIKSTEEVINLQCKPQAVFHVRSISRCASSIPGHGQPILAAQFSPASSNRLVTGAGDNTARIWDCDSGTPLYTLKGHNSWVLVVSWSPDASVIATAGMDNTIRLWNPETARLLGSPLKGHTKWIRSLAWEPYHLQLPRKPRLASASKDSTVRIWDVTSRRVEFVLSGHAESVSCVLWGGTGKIYTSSHDKTIKIWDADKGVLLDTLTAHAHWINHLALSTDFVLRTAFHDHTGKSPQSDEEKRIKAKERFVKVATVNGIISERLVSASNDCTIYLWDPASSTKPVTRLLGHQQQVNHVSFAPDGKLICSAAYDNHLKLWNASGAFLFTLRGHVGPVYMASFSGDSRLLVSASKDNTLKVSVPKSVFQRTCIADVASDGTVRQAS